MWSLELFVLELHELREPSDFFGDRCHHDLALFVLLVQEQLDCSLADRTANLLDLLALRVSVVLRFTFGALVGVAILDDVVVANVDFRELGEDCVRFGCPSLPGWTVTVFTTQNLWECKY